MGFRAAQYGCQFVCEFRTWHDFRATCRAGLRRKFHLNMGQKTNNRNGWERLSRLRDSFQRLVFGIQINYHQCGRMFRDVREESAYRRAGAHLDANMFGSFQYFGLKK